VRTTAVRRGDHWVINGSKMFITNAPVGDVFVVFATEDRSLGSRGITAFIVERGFPGFSSGRELDKMGNRTSPTGELILQDCEVPAENVLGAQRQGFAIAKAALEWERFLMMAHSVGTMQAVLRDSLAYARERRQFGKAIFQQPAIQAKLADMHLNAAAGELFVRRVAWLKDQQQPTPLESSSCKIFCSAAVMQAAAQGVQILGGFGYLRENPVERAMRDAKLAEIGGGTTEIQRQVVGRHVLSLSDQRWDEAYTPEQIAARCKPPAKAPDRVSACLALAEQTRRTLELPGPGTSLDIAAAATGLAEAALDEALAYARPLMDGDAAQLAEFKLADIRTHLDGARMLVHKAAVRLDRGDDAAEDVRIARIFAADAAAFCAEQAASLAGPTGNPRLVALLEACHAPELAGSSLLLERLALARSLARES
jgi:alkylation response protein AidB-like acyl-CoA dehydrogenase